MLKAVYNRGSSPDLEVTWKDGDLLLDLSAAVIGVKVYEFGSDTILFTETSVGLAQGDGTVEPNLTVQWDTGHGSILDSLDAGQYIIEFDSTGSVVGQTFGQIVVRVNAPQYGYCEVGDLLLGDLTLPANFDHYKYINDAADVMNAELGQRYTLPIPSDVLDWIAAKLKTINAQMASGLILMAQAQATQDNQLNAYGIWLYGEGKAGLMAIISGDSPLTGVPIESTTTHDAASITQKDTKSGVDAFTDFTGSGPCVRPGFGLTPWRPGF